MGFPGDHKMKELIDVLDATTTDKQLESMANSIIYNDVDGAIAIVQPRPCS